ncbi:MAG: hypothetical protein HYR67_03930 [Bacteroidetes bacterium]|nr:hypothetical protein [Bacteroidota bacterium]
MRTALRLKESFSENRETFSYPNTSSKNPSVINYYINLLNTVPNSVVELTYDNKKHIDHSPFLYNEFCPFSTNNVVSVKTSLMGATHNRTITYKYNSEGYPILRTTTVVNGTFSTKYVYNCR